MEQKMVENLAEIITNTFKDMASTDTVVGKQFKIGDFTVVPVISVSMGFGTGGGSGDSEKEGKGFGGGGGGGLKVEPLAFLVSYGNEVNLLNLQRGKGLEAVFESMPEVIGETGNVIKDLLKKNKDEEDKEDKD